jgi:hypothetical protein
VNVFAVKKMGYDDNNQKEGCKKCIVDAARSNQ